MQTIKSALVSQKYRRRARSIITNSINSLLLPVLNIAVSALVVRLASVDLWGEFVQILIVVNFGAHIIAWGNQEYLLRAFARAPAEIGQEWKSSLRTRLLLFLGLCVVIFFLDWPLTLRFWGMFWTLGLVVAQSNKVLVVYQKDFVYSIIVETSGVIVIAGGILFRGGSLNLTDIVTLFGIAHVFRGAALTLRYRRYTLEGGTATLSQDRFNLSYLRLAFPFFLLGFSGMLQSRMDLYAVNFYLSEREVGEYQVFINLMLYLQALANFILLPFVKNIYRLDSKTIRRISLRLAAFGIAILVPALYAASIGLNFIFSIDLPISFFVYGGLFVLPIYYYLPVIYKLFKENRQNIVLWTNGIGIGVNFVLNIILLPIIGPIGAILSTAVSQWVMLGVYLWKS